MGLKSFAVLLFAALALLPLCCAAGSLNLSETSREKWDFKTAPSKFVDSSPAVGGNMLFIGAEDRNVYAFDVLSGAKKWSFLTGAPVESSPRYFGGIVYIGSNDNYVYALNASTGALVWKYNASDTVYSSPVIANNVLYVGSADGSILALDALTGGYLWGYKTDNAVYSSPTVTAGIVYCGSNDRRLYALNASDGSLLWAYETGGAIYSSPIVFNNKVFFGSYDGKVYSLDAFNGSLAWMFSTGDRVVSSPTIAKGTLWIGSGDGSLYAISAFSGEQLWAYEVGKPIESTPFYNSRSGVLYFGANDNRLYSLDAVSGVPLWGFETSNWVTSSPILFGSLVYAGSYDGAVYALSTISSTITYPRKNQDIVSQTLVITGVSSADAGVRYVEVQFGSDPTWHTATGDASERGFNWTYTQGLANMHSGSYILKVRTTDASGVTESAPYAAVTVILRPVVTPEKTMRVEFPARLKRGDVISITVTDTDGNAVPYAKVTMLGQSYYDENGDGVVETDQSGNSIIVEQDEGEIQFTVEKEGFSVNPSQRLAIQIYKDDNTTLYISAGAGLVVLVLIGYFWTKRKEPDYS